MLLNYDQFINTIPTKKAFVLFGSKLTYSISSNIHNKIFDVYDFEAEYYHVEIEKHQLESAINHLKTYFCGANITIPYKSDVIKFIDECDQTSLRLNSVNTIKVENVKTYGFNTDIIGIYESLALDNISIHNKKAALLGYGGTANVVADILAKANVEITIFGRNLQKAQELKQNTLKNYPNVIIETSLFDDFTDDFDLIFNTTPIGMNDLEGISPIKDFHNAKYVFDCIYNPQITKIVDLANQYGVKSRSGLYMLYTQALYAESIWNDFDVSKTNDIYGKLSNELFKKRLADKNIVLYGFMGCGKSTISKLLSQVTGFDRIDTDEYIEEINGISISQMFETKGEAYFREQETKCTYALSEKENLIISVGGGFVIDEKNVELLKKNCIFVFLDTPFEELTSRILNDDTRPLSKVSDLKGLFDKRYPIYSKIQGISINRHLTPDEIVTEIIGKV